MKPTSKPGAVGRARSLTARLETRLQPSLHWGAEFLANEVRLCCFREQDGKPSKVESFQGSYAEADAYARAHGLELEGLHAAVSHLPFKLEALETPQDGGGAEEDILPQADRLRPPGLPMESLELQTLVQGDQRYLILSREEVLHGFYDNLPASLRSLWSLTASPLALLPVFTSTLGSDNDFSSGRMAALMIESNHTHLFFFRGGMVEAYSKVFIGWEDARKDAAGFAREMKKTLVYHYGSRFPGESLDAVQVWKDGPGKEAAAALAGLGITQVTPAWPEAFASLPDDLRVAGALALRSLQGLDPTMSFAVPPPLLAESRKLWLRRTATLARVGYRALAGVALGVIILSLSALALRWTVQNKARTWSGELAKWDEYQKRKSAVETQLQGLQGLLSRRTEGYAGLQRIASLLPPEVWLESWEMETGPDQRVTHHLSGYAITEARVPEFLANLEKGRQFHSVKLKSTERIKGEAVEEKTKIQANRKDLIHFEMGVVE